MTGGAAARSAIAERARTGTWVKLLALAIAGCGAGARDPRAATPRPPTEVSPILLVDRLGDRVFVVMEELGSEDTPVLEETAETGADGGDGVEPSTRSVPTRFRLAGPDGACVGENGRAVELETLSVDWHDEERDADFYGTYRTLAAEIDPPSCDARFAIPSSRTERFAWEQPYVEREPTRGALGPPGADGGARPVVREPVGVAGTLPSGATFEDHTDCDERHELELAFGTVTHRLEWNGYGFGLLHFGARTYLADRTLTGWRLQPLGGPRVHAVLALPSLRAVDVDHAEMEWPLCEVPD